MICDTGTPCIYITVYFIPVRGVYIGGICDVGSTLITGQYPDEHRFKRRGQKDRKEGKVGPRERSGRKDG